MPYTNPTAVSAGNPQFGDSDKFNIPSFIQPFPFEQQKTESGDFLNRYRGAIAGQEGLPQQYERLASQLQIPGLREQSQAFGEQIGDITSALRAIPRNITPTRGAIMTQGQRERAIAQESDPLRRQLTDVGAQAGEIGQRLSTAQSELGRRMGLEQQQQQKELLPFELEYDDISRRQAREFSGYTFTNQLELERLLGNRQAGLEWSNAEANRAHELAKQEKAYELELSNAEALNQDYSNQFWELFF